MRAIAQFELFKPKAKQIRKEPSSASIICAAIALGSCFMADEAGAALVSAMPRIWAAHMRAASAAWAPFRLQSHHASRRGDVGRSKRPGSHAHAQRGHADDKQERRSPNAWKRALVGHPRSYSAHMAHAALMRALWAHMDIAQGMWASFGPLGPTCIKSEQCGRY